jgi:hypothetical protein
MRLWNANLHRVIRKLRRLGYLEASIDVAVATGSDPLLDNEPERARSMAASVRQCIACCAPEGPALNCR